jgi:hypothetical protein
LERYLKWVGLIAAAALLVTVIINALVDPYGILGTPAIGGLTAPKTESHFHSRLVRECEVCRVAPEAVILGASDAALGLDPMHSGWSARPVYNLGISAGNLHEIRRYLEHAEARHPLRQAVLSLDLTSFDEQLLGDKPDFDDASLGRPGAGEGECRRELEPWLVLASLDTFYSSIATVGKNLREGPTWIALPDGMGRWRGADAAIADLGGARGMFMAVVGNHVNGDLLPPMEYSFRLGDQSDPHSRFEDFRAIVDLALKRGIDLRVMFGPLHAYIVETRRAIGLEDDYERMVRGVVQIVAAESAKYPAAPAPVVWDFGGYNSITTEEVPPAGDMTPMRWYMDPVHYRPELGNLILHRIFGVDRAAGAVALARTSGIVTEDFGIRLTPQNVDSVLARMRDGGAQYRESHLGALAMIQATVRTAIDRRIARGVGAAAGSMGPNSGMAIVSDLPP